MQRTAAQPWRGSRPLSLISRDTKIFGCERSREQQVRRPFCHFHWHISEVQLFHPPIHPSVHPLSTETWPCGRGGRRLRGRYAPWTGHHPSQRRTSFIPTLAPGGRLESPVNMSGCFIWRRWGPHTNRPRARPDPTAWLLGGDCAGLLGGHHQRTATTLL